MEAVLKAVSFFFILRLFQSRTFKARVKYRTTYTLDKKNVKKEFKPNFIFYSKMSKEFFLTKKRTVKRKLKLLPPCYF